MNRNGLTYYVMQGETAIAHRHTLEAAVSAFLAEHGRTHADLSLWRSDGALIFANIEQLRASAPAQIWRDDSKEQAAFKESATRGDYDR
jgi:hypothetical protein